MATGPFTTCPPSWVQSSIFKNFNFRKTAKNFTGISRKHLFLVSNKKIIESKVKKKILEQDSQQF